MWKCSGCKETGVFPAAIEEGAQGHAMLTGHSVIITRTEFTVIEGMKFLWHRQ
jgi:hypothetical protein